MPPNTTISASILAPMINGRRLSDGGGATGRAERRGATCGAGRRGAMAGAGRSFAVGGRTGGRGAAA